MNVWFKILCLYGLLSLSSATPAQQLQAPEPQIKAAFLYNLAKLVEWPTNTFATSNSPLIIGILGKDPFGKDLDNILRGKTISGRRVQPVRFATIEAALHNCHVLFISESERRALPQILARLNTRPILTVSDLKDFRISGMIELVKKNDTIGLAINLKAADQAGLQLSSRLLRLDPTLQPPDPATTNRPGPAHINP